MKLIPLTKGYSAIVDDVDAVRLANKRYFVGESKAHHLSYACRKQGGKRVWLAYDVLGLTPEDTKEQRAAITFLNGDRLDCRRENLQVQTISKIITMAKSK